MHYSQFIGGHIMKYTEEVKQALSRRVAEKFKLQWYLNGGLYEYGENYDGWLHDDWHTICELCVKHRISAASSKSKVMARSWNGKIVLSVSYADCNDDPSLAERIARLLALSEVKL